MEKLKKARVIINTDSPVEMMLNDNLTLSNAHSLIIGRLDPSFNDPRYKFFFKALGVDILDIQDLTISDIINQNLIYMKRVLHIKVIIDGCLSKYYDLGSLDDNLFNIRQILHDEPIIPSFFKFLRGEHLISETEEKHHGLREILNGCDELFIYSVNENSNKSVTICKYLQSDKIEKYTEYLPTAEKLIQIRTLLKMGPNFTFRDGDKKINRSSEASIGWINIAWIENEKLQLKIYQDNDLEWNELVSQCDMGFTFKAAPSLPLSYLPYFSLLANASNESSESHSKTTKYSSIVISKAKLSLDETNIILDNSFIEEVNSALVDDHSRNKKLKELGRILKKYGHFYASEVIFGGAIIENYENISSQTKDSSSLGVKVVGDFELLVHAEGGYESNDTTSKTVDMSKEMLAIIGGDEILFVKNDPEAIKSWRNSFNNSKHWRIISYKIRPIFDLLDNGLKNKVLEALGEQILKVGTITHHAELECSNLNPIVIDSWSNGIFEDVTSNPLQCQILASIMNKDNHIYSLRIEYVDEDTPVFVIHYLEKFIFEQRNHDIKITKKKCEEMAKVKIDNHLSYKCPIEQFFNHSSKLGICVIQCPSESSNYDVYQSKMVTGIHFSPEKLACMFVHDLDDCTNVGNTIDEISPSKIICSIIDIKDNKSCMLEVEWKNSGRHNLFSDISKKLIVCDEHKKYLTSLLEECFREERIDNPLFMSIFNNCSQHGFINITPKCPIYFMLNRTNNTPSEFK
ncbi:6240_t:CDS:2, partial [Dentiscutata erythropus]